MRIQRYQITSFMLAMGLVQDQASQILERAQCDNNHTEELLNALYPANVLLPGTSEYSNLIKSYLYVSAVPVHCFRLLGAISFTSVAVC